MKNKRKRTGRPTKRTKERVEAFLEVIRRGSTIKEACFAAGISVETYSQWIKKFPEFSDQKQRAEFEPMKQALSSITRGMYHDWRAAAWWLERREPERFGKRRIIEQKPSLIQDMYVEDYDDDEKVA